MQMVADTSTFLAVALDEPEKPWLVHVTQGHSLLAPAVLPYELGNALSAIVKRRMLTPEQALDAWDATDRMAVELIGIDVRAALALAGDFQIYAYDAYFLQSALEARCPLLTLAGGMRRIAREMGLRLVEPS